MTSFYSMKDLKIQIFERLGEKKSGIFAHDYAHSFFGEDF